MANYLTDYYIKDYSIYDDYKDTSSGGVLTDNELSNNCTTTTFTNCSTAAQNNCKKCINTKLNENLQRMKQIETSLFKTSASNENYENKKMKYYNEYMIFFNMSVGVVGLIYYVYFFIKNKQQ